jgi:hypothetical protein
MTLKVTEPETVLCDLWDTESLQIVLFQDAKTEGNWRRSSYIHTKETSPVPVG